MGRDSSLYCVDELRHPPEEGIGLGERLQYLVYDDAYIRNAVEDSAIPAISTGSGCWEPERHDTGQYNARLWGTRTASAEADAVLCAEAERFELSIPCGIPVFETGGINHYPTPPVQGNIP